MNSTQQPTFGKMPSTGPFGFDPSQISDGYVEIRCSPLELVLSRLPDASEAGGEWSSRCPAHEDGRASLSITQGTDGRALVHCFAGCEPSAICDAIGLKVTDLFARASTLTPATQPPKSREKPKGGRTRHQVGPWRRWSAVTGQ